MSFKVFLAAVGCRPSNEHSLERKNNNQGYEPGNVEWATREQQARNTRRNRFLEYDGERLTVVAWAQKLELDLSTIYYRLKQGWSIEKVLAPARKTGHKPKGHPPSGGIPPKLLTLNGVTLSQTAWARKLGIGETTLRKRLEYGFPIEKVLSSKDHRLR